MAMNITYFDGTEHTCAVCGKKFNCTAEYVYKQNFESKVYFFCRYNHMRDWERRKEGIDKLRDQIRKISARYYKTKDPIVKKTRKEDIDALREELKKIEGFPVFNYNAGPAVTGNDKRSSNAGRVRSAQG